MSSEIENTLKDKERICELIKTSLGLFKGPKCQLGDNFLTGELNSTIFERKSLILGKLLDKRTNYNLKKKLKKLKYSHGLKDNRYVNPLREIVKEMKQEQIIDDNLLKKFFKKLDIYLETIKNKPLIVYTLIYPINLNFKDGIPVKFLQKHKDIYIRLVPRIHDYSRKIWDYINDNYPEDTTGLDRNREVRDLFNACNRRGTHYFIVKVYARNIGFAVKKSSEDLEINVGLYAFALYYGIRKISFDMGPFPSEHGITKIRLPLVYVLLNDECKNILFTFYEKLSTPKDLSLETLRLIADTISIIQDTKNKKLYSILIEAFSYYYDALKTSSYSISFLKFWNIIERLLLNEAGITLTEIITRLKSTYPDTEPTKKDLESIIDLLYQKRNKLVHESKDSIRSDDRDLMKSMVEHVILTLLNLRLEFDNIGMLAFFYQNLRKPLRVIKDEFKVLEILEKIKSRENQS